jgi:CRISPR-associated endonuclease/helicase Cas3
MNFDAAFTALTDQSPLPWQGRLYRELVARRLPTALDLPTGLGKTSVIAIWAAARASSAPVPRRLIYVVDRRAVVDQATEVADSIARKLGDGSGASEIIDELRRGLGFEHGMTLPVSTLRGQYTDNRAWLASPASPAIVVGTVDMIGSRLLFQGYGVSPRTRSVHAALLGADAWLVLDEAHLVPPFEHLARAVAAWPRPEGIPAFRLLTLSATGRTEGDAPFRLTQEDEGEARTGARLRAPKRVSITEVDTDPTEAMAQKALDLGGTTSRVLVFCDSRRVAQRVADRLGVLARAKFGRDVAAPALLVGGRRVWERTRLADDSVFVRFRPMGKARGDEALPTIPAFLVATSAGEVGVDLDADHLVMDLVPWERMVQRLGRVNRRAQPGESLVDIFAAVPEKDAEANADDGNDFRAWRAPFSSDAWEVGGDGRRDGSPLRLLRLKQNSDFASLAQAASTREPYHPALSGPLLDAWSMTSLDVHPGRTVVTPWLRGWVKEEPQTRLVWRLQFPLRDGELDDIENRGAIVRVLQTFFAAAAPHLSEALDIPTYQAVEFVRKRIAAVSSPRRGDSNTIARPPLLVVLDADGDVETVFLVKSPEEFDTKELIRRFSERTVVLDARLGGLDAHGMLDDKHDAPPITLDADGADAWSRAAGFRVRRMPRSASTDRDWPIEYRLDLSDDEEDGEELRVERLRSADATEGDAAIARVPQSLSEHHSWTADAARRISQQLGLSSDQEGMLVAAAGIHDAGKARALWQNAMRAPSTDRPYAKTTGGGDFRTLMVNGVTYRHEFGSIGDAEQNSALKTLPDDLRELATHLVASHHGFARPTIAPIDPDVPPSVAVERARDIALRFHRMQRRWGPWGLAWWEALLRAADWAASRAANEKDRRG